MVLFFSAARVVFWGYTLAELEAGHTILMQKAFAQVVLRPELDKNLVILSNRRLDMPGIRDDGTIGLWGLAMALLRAQTLPKYQHGMRQPWNHPTRSLPRVQTALYRRLWLAITTPLPQQAAVYLGGALHTLQDTYTIGHTERENNADPFSPLVRLHYSPSKIHPLISPHDRVWADTQKTRLTPEAAAAVQATVAALQLWQAWRGKANPEPALAAFIERYTPIRGQPFCVDETAGNESFRKPSGGL